VVAANDAVMVANHNMCILLYLVMYDSGQVSLEHLLLSRQPSTTEGPMWGHPMPVLGALSPFLEPFCGHLSPKLDNVS